MLGASPDGNLVFGAVTRIAIEWSVTVDGPARLQA
jgi:hypothetical protein